MAATWTVDGDQAGQFDWVNGNPVEGHLISYTTGNGNPGTVFIPNNLYATPAHGRKLIQAAANVTDEYAVMHS